MSRYIDKDLLFKKINSFISTDEKYTDYNCGYDDCICAVQDTIEDMPEVDIIEAKHGKWIVHNDKKDWQSDNYMLHIECSKCGKAHFLGTTKYANEYNNEKLKTIGTYSDYSYCGKCGAKMDGDKQ